MCNKPAHPPSALLSIHPPLLVQYLEFIERLRLLKVQQSHISRTQSPILLNQSDYVRHGGFAVCNRYCFLSSISPPNQSCVHCISHFYFSFIESCARSRAPQHWSSTFPNQAPDHNPRRIYLFIHHRTWWTVFQFKPAGRELLCSGEGAGTFSIKVIVPLPFFIHWIPSHPFEHFPFSQLHTVLTSKMANDSDTGWWGLNSAIGAWIVRRWSEQSVQVGGRECWRRPIKLGTLTIVKTSLPRPTKYADYLGGKQYSKVLLLLKLLGGRQVD